MEHISTGTIYCNPKPYLRSRQAFHPSLICLGGSELLCTFDIGEAVESLDYRTYVSRSTDLPLWGSGLSDSGMTGQARSSDELSALKFGYPSLLQLPEGEVLVAFWGLAGWSSNILWIRLRISP